MMNRLKRSCTPINYNVNRNQEYSSRTLGATWGIISAVMLPIVIVLICVGWRVLKRRKAEEKEEDEFMSIKTRPIDPDESIKLNSDEESIPYKKDIEEESPLPSDPVQVVDNTEDNQAQQYDGTQPLSAPYNQQQRNGRQWAGETEIN